MYVPLVMYIVMQYFHRGHVTGHFGVNSTLLEVRWHFFWPGQRSNIEHWCIYCDISVKHDNRKLQGVARLQYRWPSAPMECLAVDVLSPLPPSVDKIWVKNSHILVVSDYFPSGQNHLHCQSKRQSIRCLVIRDCTSIWGAERVTFWPGTWLWRYGHSQVV